MNTVEYSLSPELNERFLRHIEETYPIREAEE